MDGTFNDPEMVATKPPGNRSATHHAWLEADATDRAANYAAYRLARDDFLDDEVCAQVFDLHDSAQHHFITMILWKRGGHPLTIDEALFEAKRHHKQVQKSWEQKASACNDMRFFYFEPPLRRAVCTHANGIPPPVSIAIWTKEQVPLTWETISNLTTILYL